MRNIQGVRFFTVIPTVLMAGLLILGAEPHRDLVAERAFAEGAARQEAEQTLRREADQAARYLNVQQDVALAVLKQRLAEQVDAAHAMMMAIYSSAHSSMGDEALKKLLRDSLREARFFDGRGYFFIDGMDGQVILMPLHPDREGSMLLGNRDDQGTYIMQGLIDAANQSGGAGYFSYRWFSPQDQQKMDEKVAYVRHFEPYDWLVGAGDYVPAIEEDIIAEAVMRMDAVRFGVTGGVGLSSTDGAIALFPEARSTENSHGDAMVSIKDPAAVDLWKRVSAAAAEGGGFIIYQWPHPVSGRLEPRGAWVESVSANGRVIYASAHLSDFMPPQQAETTAPLLTRFRAVSIALLAFAASLLLAWMIPVHHDS
jgi:signal transduction histidine kinase